MLKLIRSFKSKFHLKRIVIKQNWKKELNVGTKKKKKKCTEYLEIAFLLFVACICTQWITWIHGLFQYINSYLHLGVTKQTEAAVKAAAQVCPSSLGSVSNEPIWDLLLSLTTQSLPCEAEPKPSSTFTGRFCATYTKQASCNLAQIFL